jgi:ABC-type bacteriocin/lantibiotic exporters, contain an N-terminal double-glycine peptidase domain
MVNPAFTEQIEERLLSILQVEQGRPNGHNGGLLLHCMNLAGAAQGLHFNCLPGKAIHSITRRLQAIALQSNVLARRVRLHGKWWSHDGGDMVGFTKTGEVCALVQERGDYYYLNPRTGEKSRLNFETNATLSEVAYVFYPLFAEGRVTKGSLLRFALGGRRKELVAFLGCSLVVSCLNLALPLAFSSLIGNVIPSANKGMLVQLCILLVLIGLMIFSFMLYRNLIMLRIESKIDLKLQAAFFNKLINLPSAFFARHNAGDIVERSLGVSKIRVIASSGMVAAFFSMLQVLTNLGLMFWYSPQLGLLVMMIVCIYLIILLLFYRSEHLANKKHLDSRAVLTSRIYQFIAGISKIKTAGKELFILRRWSEDYARERQLAQHIMLAGHRVQLLNYLFPGITLLLVYGFSGRIVNTLSAGAFAGFITAFGLLTAGIIAFGSSVSGLLKGVSLYKKLEGILESPAEKEPAFNEQVTLKGRIEFNQVSYSYNDDGPPILDGLSFVINEGETVAFVGASGSGKSTIFRLLLGFETPKSGSIYFDEQDLKQLNKKAVRRNMGVVLQSSTLTGGSIYENIAGSNTGYSAVWEALAKVGMKEEIEAFPMGLHTIVSDAGGSLSGGQRQRLLIARALIRNPSIILLDEATSALDNISQAIITKTLQEIKATKVLIAHRLETVMCADRVYFIGNGKIIQSGKPGELMNMDGPFKNFASRQLK